jgi:hypothetical protein
MKKQFYHIWYKCKNCGYEASREMPFAAEATPPFGMYELRLYAI